MSVAGFGGLRRLRQEDLEIKPSLGYTLRVCQKRKEKR
jgi:hypothetical protein